MSYFLTLASEVAESLLPTTAFAAEPVDADSEENESEDAEEADEEEEDEDDEDDDDDEVPDPAIALNEGKYS